MSDWIYILLPSMMIFARVGAFVSAMPVFSWTMTPVRIRVAFAVSLTIMFGCVIAPTATVMTGSWIDGVFLIMGEILTGLSIGLTARLVYASLQQGIIMGTQQMGFMDAGIIDPGSGERVRPVGMLFSMMLVIVFFSIGGHHLLLRLMGQSFLSFPLGSTPTFGDMASGLIEAGSVMLMLGLKIASPLLAGFLMLGMVLGIAARVMPEINILMASLPLRIFIGLTISVLLVDSVNDFAEVIYEWIDVTLIV